MFRRRGWRCTSTSLGTPTRTRKGSRGPTGLAGPGKDGAFHSRACHPSGPLIDTSWCAHGARSG